MFFDMVLLHVKHLSSYLLVDLLPHTQFSIQCYNNLISYCVCGTVIQSKNSSVCVCVYFILKHDISAQVKIVVQKQKRTALDYKLQPLRHRRCVKKQSAGYRIQDHLSVSAENTVQF